MKIVIADPLPAAATNIFREKGWTVYIRSEQPMHQLHTELADADGLIIRSATRVDKDLLLSAPKLRIIARAGTGVDNIDIEAASETGVLVVNAPGVNSISVAEHAFALLLATARSVPLANAGLKAGKWEKKQFIGIELRGKTLGVVGLGRIGQAMVQRAHAFSMRTIAHDPFITTQVAEGLNVELLELDELCDQADFISLHVPTTGAEPLFNAERLAKCQSTVQIINTARGTLIDETALADAIEEGGVGGAGLDVFTNEPPHNNRLLSLPQVIATPHIAGSTHEAQEMVAVETVACVRDFLEAGTVRNAVNYPSLSQEDSKRIQPYMLLAKRLGAFLAQISTARPKTLGIRYYGKLAEGNNEVLVGVSLVGLFGETVSHATPINARALANERGIEIIESRSSRPRNFTSLISIKLHTELGEHWVEGALFEQAGPRLVLVDGVTVEAPLEGTLIVIKNDDQPGVIGEVGMLLGRHGINIATFALGRGPAGAVAVVKIDHKEPAGYHVSQDIIKAITEVDAVRYAEVVTV